jgi:hypothetical protein
MNDETKDPVAPSPAADAAPAANAVPVAEAAAPIEAAPPAAAPAVDAAPVEAKLPEAMPVIFNTGDVTPKAPPPPAGGPMAAVRSGFVLILMMGLAYVLLTDIGVLKPFGHSTSAPTGADAILAKAQHDSLAADEEAMSAQAQQRLHPPPALPYPAPTLTVTAGMIGDRRSFPDPPPSAAGSARPPGKKGALDEGQTLDAARASLAKGESAKALVILDGHDRDFPQGLMKPDAKVLRIEALARTGEDAKAKELAENFLADFPHSPLAPRTRGLLDAINRKMAGGL